MCAITFSSWKTHPNKLPSSYIFYYVSFTTWQMGKLYKLSPLLSKVLWDITAKKMKLPSLFKKKEVQCLSKCIPPIFAFHKTVSSQTTAGNVNNFSSRLSDATELIAGESAWPCSEERQRQALDKAFQAMRSERLFLELNDTSSISVGDSRFPFQEFVVVALQSNDPYVNFRISMEEMIEDYGLQANGLKDWNYLEALLAWYLRMNSKTNHGFIVAAFVDMIVAVGIL